MTSNAFYQFIVVFNAVERQYVVNYYLCYISLSHQLLLKVIRGEKQLVMLLRKHKVLSLRRSRVGKLD